MVVGRGVGGQDQGTCAGVGHVVGVLRLPRVGTSGPATAGRVGVEDDGARSAVLTMSMPGVRTRTTATAQVVNRVDAGQRLPVAVGRLAGDRGDIGTVEAVVETVGAGERPGLAGVEEAGRRRCRRRVNGRRLVAARVHDPARVGRARTGPGRWRTGPVQRRVARVGGGEGVGDRCSSRPGRPRPRSGWPTWSSRMSGLTRRTSALSAAVTGGFAPGEGRVARSPG